MIEMKNGFVIRVSLIIASIALVICIDSLIIGYFNASFTYIVSYPAVMILKVFSLGHPNMIEILILLAFQFTTYFLICLMIFKGINVLKTQS